MRAYRSAVALLIVGLGIGVVVGLGISARIVVTPDRWWALAGSLLGAIVAIAGSIFAIHYEADQSAKAERRRLAEQIDGVLKLITEFHAASEASPPEYSEMRPTMQKMHAEHHHLWLAMQKLKHTSAEISRASKFVVQGDVDHVHVLAVSNHDTTWDANAKKHVEKLQHQMEQARAELKV